MDLDRVRLDEITGGDMEIARELVRMTVDDSEGIIAQLQGVAGDPTRSAGLAHELKGICANVGAQRLSTAAAAFEAALRGGEAGAAQACLDEIRSAYAGLRASAAALDASALGG